MVDPADLEAMTAMRDSCAAFGRTNGQYCSVTVLRGDLSMQVESEVRALSNEIAREFVAFAPYLEAEQPE
jgi:hypothetical protein